MLKWLKHTAIVFGAFVAFIGAAYVTKFVFELIGQAMAAFLAVVTAAAGPQAAAITAIAVGLFAISALIAAIHGLL